MSDRDVKVKTWAEPQAPTEAELRRRLVAEGLQPYAWRNAPGDVYAAHAHEFHKVIYVVHGGITFGLPAAIRQVRMQAGDRLELPPGVVHAAVVGPQGVLCLEAHVP